MTSRRLLKSTLFNVLLGLLTLLGTVLPTVANAQSVGASLEQGMAHYQVGRFSEAAAAWEQASQQYQQHEQPLNAALSLSYLSLAAQELGQWEQAQKSITQSLNLLDQSALNGEGLAIQAQALNTKGNLELARGQAQAAFDTWEQAEVAYRQAEDETGVLGSQINQAQALQTLGLYRRSRQLLEKVNETLQEQPDSQLKTTGLQSLGGALQVSGDLEQSRTVLQQSLDIAQRLNLPSEAILLSLGNTARGLDTQAALSYYQQAATVAASPLAKLEAQLNQLSLLIETEQWQEVQSLLSQIQPLLTKLEPSRAAVFAQVNLAQSLLKYHSATGQSPTLSTLTLLTQAQQQANTLNNRRAKSYVLGTLGRLYEQEQQWGEAQQVTGQALAIAQSLNAADIAYQWQYQLGRLLEAQQDTAGAIAYTAEAVNTLESLRGDLVAINPDVQFSFRESVEPIYRELVRLLLSTPTPDSLNQARQTIESLQVAELENFFREACLTAQPKQIDAIDPTAAVVYPIILKDRLAVILSLPGQPLHYHETRLSQSEVESTLNRLFQSLNPAFSNRERLRLSEQVYDWLIRPVEQELVSSQIETLVFVLDGSLRNLPMAALYNGEQYLVEKYSVALAPGLVLLDSQPLAQDRLKAVLAGISESNIGFSALPAVDEELALISSQLPSEELLNGEFTKTSFQEQIEKTPFPVIHLATHGQFSSNPQETFIVTWQDRVRVNELTTFLRTREQDNLSPLELLVLSACQTAAGDKQATLGLAGVAVRSGARSTLATLWSVKDESTAVLMTEFYQALTQAQAGVTKAEALRQSQIALIESPQFNHPLYWAPFVLVGNWL